MRAMATQAAIRMKGVLEDFFFMGERPVRAWGMAAVLEDLMAACMASMSESTGPALMAARASLRSWMSCS